MKLISVNLGEECAIDNGKPSETSGIFKNPVSYPVQVTALGLVDDVVVDKKHHGGLDQAVYIYGGGDYNWWSQALGKEIGPGTFGDNLTISELQSAEFSIGDSLAIGKVILQVTAPRIPCDTLAARMGDPNFIKRFRLAERPGLYCRVLKEGQIQVGQAVLVQKYTSKTITILEMFRDYYKRHLSEADLRRHLEAPIAIRARKEKEEQLERILSKELS